MDEINNLLNYVDFVITGICLCVGYALKVAFEKFPNRYIPMIMLFLGTLINVAVSGRISAEIVLTGMISGLVSTGMYELFKNLIGKK